MKFVESHSTSWGKRGEGRKEGKGMGEVCRIAQHVMGKEGRR